MKLIFPFLLLLACVTTTFAQVTSLNENFDVSCATTGANYPLGWSEINTVAPLSALAWTCAPLDGRWGTGGIECNSYYSGVNYKDTAWLFTPQLDLSGYTGNIYLRFDSKYEFIAARLSVLASNHYTPGTNPDSVVGGWEHVDSASTMSPVIDPTIDSADWVTHWINLTAFKGVPIYIAFRYISSSTAGGVWTIDNVLTTLWGMGIKDPESGVLPITILGNSTTDKIVFSAGVQHAGEYYIDVYDIVGRKVHSEKVNATASKTNYTLSDMNLMPGMYIVKMGNETTYGVTKTVVQ